MTNPEEQAMKRSEAEIEADRKRNARVLVAQAEALAEAFEQALAYDQVMLAELRYVVGQKQSGGLLASLNPNSPWDRDGGLPELVRRAQSLRAEGRAL